MNYCNCPNCQTVNCPNATTAETERKTMIDLAQIAYEAFCNHTGWKSLISRAPLPQWNDLKPEIQNAWRAAANALVN